MSNYIAKQVSKKLLGETIANKFGKEDPYFEQVPATRLGRRTGKFKKVRKALPPGLSEHDAKVLTKVKRRAYRLDLSLFNCCGIQFGWSSVIGIVPAIGDALDAFMAMMVIHTCQQVEGGLPNQILARMYMNVVLDFVVGLVPFLGDLADAVYKANTRNAAILEDYLREKGRKNLRASGVALPAIDPSDPDEFDRFQSESPPAYTSQQPSRQHNMTATGRGPQTAGVTTPQPARTRNDGQQRSGGGFFGSKKSRPADVEMGVANPNQPAKLSRRG